MVKVFELISKTLQDYIDLVGTTPSMAISINNHSKDNRIAKMDNSKGSDEFGLLPGKRIIETLEYDILLFMNEETYRKMKNVFGNIPVYKGLQRWA